MYYNVLLQHYQNWCFWAVVLEKTLESPLDCKEIHPVHPKGDQSWVFIGSTDAKAETPVLWPPHVKSWLIGKDWCWEGLGAGGEGDDRGWDGWIASPTWWTWVWVNFGSWWWTGRPGMLRFMGSQRVGHDWATVLNLTELKKLSSKLKAWISSVHHELVFNNFSTLSVQFTHVWLFATPWIAACQASLSITNSQSSLRLPSIESMMPSSHLILCCPFSSCRQSLPASESFPMSQLFAWGGQSTGVSASTSVLPMNTQDWSPLGWTGWISLQSKGLARVFSNTTVQKHQFFSAQSSSQSNSHIHTGTLVKP